MTTIIIINYSLDALVLAKPQVILNLMIYWFSLFHIVIDIVFELLFKHFWKHHLGLCETVTEIRYKLFSDILC